MNQVEPAWLKTAEAKSGILETGWGPGGPLWLETARRVADQLGDKRRLIGEATQEDGDRIQVAESEAARSGQPILLWNLALCPG